MELYINSEWTKCYGENYFIAESIVWSENGNHVSIYSTGTTAEEADAKLIGALSELKLVSATSTKDAQ
jgi:hypothetical protein